MKAKIQKTNPLYLIAYIFGPILVCALGYLLCYLCFRHGGTGAVVTTMVPTALALLWWIFGGFFIFKKQTKALEQRFSAEGYKRNHTFYGRNKTVVLDIEHGMLGLAFFWNPCETYIIPASRVQKAWTDDGKSGSGFMEGTGRVSFLFTVDDIKIRVDTFVSNQRFRMDDKRVLTGISKADMMVKSIEDAKANSKKSTKTEKKSTKPASAQAAAKSDQKSESTKK